MANFLPRLEWNPLAVSTGIENTSTLTNIADTSSIEVGRVVRGTGIQFNTRVVSKTASTVLLDKPATSGIPKRTNVFTYSENYNASTKSKVRATAWENATIAPDGTLTADKLIEDTTVTNSHYSGTNITAVSGKIYFFSVYVKQSERNRVNLAVTTTAFPSNSTTFDLAAGTLVSTNTQEALISDAGNGWYRISIKLTATSSGTSQFRIQLVNTGTTTAYTGDGVSGLFVWGEQCEVVEDLSTNTNLSPYIPTLATFTSRASIASYVDSAGLIQLAPINAQRLSYTPSNLALAPKLLLELVGTNNLTYTENFDNAAWTNTRAFIAPNAAISPDGLLRADKFIEDATASNTHLVSQVATATTNQNWSFSVFAKADTRSILTMILDNNVSTADTIVGSFNLLLGTVTQSFLTGLATQPIASIQAFPNGWYRCTITGIPNTSGTAVRGQLRLNNGTTTSYTGNGVSGIFIWGAQLEVGYPTSYTSSSDSFTSRASVATFINSSGLIQSAAINAQRLNYNPSNLALSPKLLVEAAATNVALRSEQLDDATWTKSRSSVAPDATIAPDGTLTADKLIEDTTPNNSHFALQTITATVAQTWSLTFFAKSAERSSIAVSITDGGAQANNVIATFNTTTGAISTIQNNGGGFGATVYALALPNGWWRFTITGQPNTSGTSVQPIFRLNNGVASIYDGDGVSGIFLWGVQLETGYASSYIPTTTVAVTRSADVSASAATTRSADVSSSAPATRAAQLETLNFYHSLDFTYPSVKQGEPTYLPTEQISQAIGGARQVQVLNIIKKVALEFKFLTPAFKEILREDFYLGWAVYGKPFLYLESGDVDSSEEYELDNFDFKPVREIPKELDFLYKIPFTFRRVYL